MNMETLINEIIPPDDYQHRHEFNNTQIIDKLNNEERALIEEVLINKLLIKEDLLIVETLAYLKSEKSLPILYSLFDKDINHWSRIMISASIYSIKKDENMIDIAINAFKGVETNKDVYFKFRVLPLFYYLSIFKNQKTEAILNKYSTDLEYLISYNAKRALGK